MKKFFWVFTIVMLLGGLALYLLSVFNIIALAGIYLQAFYSVLCLFVAGVLSINSSNLIENKSLVGTVGITLVFFSCVPILEIIWLNMQFSTSYGYIVFANCILAFFVNSIIAFTGQLKKKAILLQFVSYLAIAGLSAYGGLRLYAPETLYNNKYVIIGFVACCLIFILNVFLLNAVVKGAIGNGKGARPKKVKNSGAPAEVAPVDPTIGNSGGPPISF